MRRVKNEIISEGSHIREKCIYEKEGRRKGTKEGGRKDTKEFYYGEESEENKQEEVFDMKKEIGKDRSNVVKEEWKRDKGRKRK